MPADMSHKVFEMKELVDQYFDTSGRVFLGQGNGRIYRFYFLKKSNFGMYWDVILSISTSAGDKLDVKGYQLEIDGIMSANGKVAIGPISNPIRLQSKEEIIDFCVKNLAIVAEARKMEKAHTIKTAAKEYL
jgi:hypothetical protein